MVSLLTYIVKKRSTCLHTNFDSLPPINFTINLITVLIYRAYHICSSSFSFHEQVVNIKRFLQYKHFPIYLIDCVINNFLDKRYINKIIQLNVPKLTALVFLPYLGSRSVHPKKKLHKFLGNIYPNMQFRFVFQSITRIEILSRLKIAPPVVCARQLYTSLRVVVATLLYGETSRHFIVCCREHLGINKKGKTIKGILSSIRDHVSGTGHSAKTFVF